MIASWTFDPTARDDVRLFVRPGVTHCMGGPGPDGTNYIAALEEWLDSGGSAREAGCAVCRVCAGQATDGTGWTDYLCSSERGDLMMVPATRTIQRVSVAHCPTSNRPLARTGKCHYLEGVERF